MLNPSLNGDQKIDVSKIDYLQDNIRTCSEEVIRLKKAAKAL